MAKEGFTFRNYFKELRHSVLLLIIFFILGALAGAYYGATRPTSFSSRAKISVYSPSANNGSEYSSYTQLADVFGSRKLLSEASETDEVKIANYSVVEGNRGVFEINASGDTSTDIKETVNLVVDNATEIIALAYGEKNDYFVTVLDQPSNVVESKPTTKTMLISSAITAISMLVLAAAIVFIKFDYKTGK